MAEPRPRKGVAIRLLGVVLIILGTLDSMLSWRGGFSIDQTYALMIAAGVLLLVIGTIRGGRQPDRTPAKQGPPTLVPHPRS